MKPLIYQVREGDNLFHISRRFGVSIELLNKLNDNELLNIGQKIIVGYSNEIDQSELAPKMFIDERDKQSYSQVEIGNQVWLSENMNYPIPGSICYEENPENCDTYGRLYNWEQAQKACPEGWRLANKLDYETLIQFLGGEDVAGGKMKSTSQVWESTNKSTTKESGFAALPGGYGVDGKGYTFLHMGRLAYFWTSSSKDIDAAYKVGLGYINTEANFNISDKEYFMSCRCIQK